MIIILTFDWILVFSAIRFSSGVSATVVALALGICLQQKNKQNQIVSSIYLHVLGVTNCISTL